MWVKSRHSAYNGDCVELWRTGSHSGAGSCVQVAAVTGKTLVRDSKLGQASPILLFPAAAWAAFVTTLKEEES